MKLYDSMVTISIQQGDVYLGKTYYEVEVFRLADGRFKLFQPDHNITLYGTDEIETGDKMAKAIEQEIGLNV